MNFVNRSYEEFSRFFDRLDLVPPGVEPIDKWLHLGPCPPPPDIEPRLPGDLDAGWVNPLWAGIGRKP